MRWVEILCRFLYLAGHLDESQALGHMAEMTVQIGDIKDVADSRFERLLELGYDGEVRSDPHASASALFAASCELAWVSDGVLNRAHTGDVDEIVAAWPALTPERRKLVRAFVADQEVLSTLDRLPNPRGRYEMSLELEPRGDRG